MLSHYLSMGNYIMPKYDESSAIIFGFTVCAMNQSSQNTGTLKSANQLDNIWDINTYCKQSDESIFEVF